MSAPALTVLPLGGDRYRVTGGAEPHVVELGDGTAQEENMTAVRREAGS